MRDVIRADERIKNQRVTLTDTMCLKHVTPYQGRHVRAQRERALARESRDLHMRSKITKTFVMPRALAQRSTLRT